MPMKKYPVRNDQRGQTQKHVGAGLGKLINTTEGRGIPLRPYDEDYKLGPAGRRAVEAEQRVQELIPDEKPISRFSGDVQEYGAPYLLSLFHAHTEAYHHRTAQADKHADPFKARVFRALARLHKNAAWEVAQHAGRDETSDDAVYPKEPNVQGHEYGPIGRQAVRDSIRAIKRSMTSGQVTSTIKERRLRPNPEDETEHHWADEVQVLRDLMLAQKHGRLVDRPLPSQVAEYEKEKANTGLNPVDFPRTGDVMDHHTLLRNAHRRLASYASRTPEEAILHKKAADSHERAITAAARSAQVHLEREGAEASRVPVLAEVSPDERKRRGTDRIVPARPDLPAPDPRVNWVLDPALHPNLHVGDWQQAEYDVVPLHTLKGWHGIDSDYIDTQVVPRLKRGDATHPFHVIRRDGVDKMGDGHHRQVGLLRLFNDPDMLVPIVRTSAPDLPGVIQPRKRKALLPEQMARYKAPAGGAITNGTYTKGGRFMAQAFRRLRDLRRDGKPIQFARADAYQIVPEGDRPAQESLTEHQVKATEKRLGLPEGSYPRAVHPVTGRVSAKIEDVAGFLDKATRSKGEAHADIHRVLNDPAVSGDEKAAHLYAHIHDEADRFLREFGAEAGGKTWYGESVDALERAVHHMVSRERPFDPASAHIPDHPLWGRYDPKSHTVHAGPGMKLFKAYMALTSGNNKPVANTLAALRLLKTGTDRAGPAGDPFMHISGYNTEALGRYRQALDALFPNDPAAHKPGVGVRERLRWYAKYGAKADKAVSKLRSADVGYMTQPVLVDKATGAPMGVDKGDAGILWLDSWKGPRDKSLARVVKLPMPDRNGGLRPKGWSSRAKDVADKVEGFKRLLTAAGGDHAKVVSWLDANHADRKTVKALKRTFQGKAEDEAVSVSRGDLEKGEATPGSFILGPKFGAFYQNLSKNPQHVTMDKWWSRTVYRLLGTVLHGGKVSEIPRSSSDRRLMRRAAQEAAKALGLTPAELQAVMWYHEQNLWRLFGAKNTSEDFKQGGQHALERFGFPEAEKVVEARRPDAQPGPDAERRPADPRPAPRRKGGEGKG